MTQPVSRNWQISSTELHLHLGSKKLTINILPRFLIYSREEKSLPSFIEIPSFCGWRDVLAQLSVKAGLLNIPWVMSSSRSLRKETPPPLLVPSTNVAFEQDCMSPCPSHPDSKPSKYPHLFLIFWPYRVKWICTLLALQSVAKLALTCSGNSTCSIASRVKAKPSPGNPDSPQAAPLLPTFLGWPPTFPP